MGRFSEEMWGKYLALKLFHLPDVTFEFPMPTPQYFVHPMNVQMKARFEALLQSTIDQSSVVLSAMARSIGGGAVTVLSQFFAENPELIALRREIASILTKDRLTSVGLVLLRDEAGSSSSASIAPTEAMMKKALSLGMDVTLAGGVDKVKGLSIKEIRALTLEVRRRGGRISATEHGRRLAVKDRTTRRSRRRRRESMSAGPCRALAIWEKRSTGDGWLGVEAGTTMCSRRRRRTNMSAGP